MASTVVPGLLGALRVSRGAALSARADADRVLRESSEGASRAAALSRRVHSLEGSEASLRLQLNEAQARVCVDMTWT